MKDGVNEFSRERILIHTAIHTCGTHGEPPASSLPLLPGDNPATTKASVELSSLQHKVDLHSPPSPVLCSHCRIPPPAVLRRRRGRQRKMGGQRRRSPRSATFAFSPSTAAALLLCCCAAALLVAAPRAGAEDPYRFFTWNVTYGDIWPFGIKQQGILINGQFPGPQIEAVTNDNLIVNVFNSLTEPFLLSWSISTPFLLHPPPLRALSVAPPPHCLLCTLACGCFLVPAASLFWCRNSSFFPGFFLSPRDWNGIQQRRNSWQDGVWGTNCPIPPGRNFTYVLQVKDQIGTYFYFPSLAFHKAAGGFGGIRILSRPMIPVPFPPPAGDFTILAGDSFKANHTDLQAMLDNGQNLPFPDGLLINGRGWNGNTFTVDQGKTYRFRVSNVGLTQSINIRIEGHTIKLVEVEGSHTLQNTYSTLDVHLGQSYSFLLTADQPGRDYYIVVSTRFTNPVLTTTAILHYSVSSGGVGTTPPGGPTIQIDYSLNQARSVRTNLTASGPRPNPQGSYHYGLINTTRTIRLANSAPIINGKQRYAVNSVSFIPSDTPLKVVDFYKISGVFSVGSIPDNPTFGGGYLQTSVMGANYRDYIEIVFENYEDTLQSWHIDGYSFFVVGMDGGQWSSASRQGYNLRDAVARCTVQVYPKSWTAIYMALDNVGMWNIRSENWARQYLGQQFYFRVYTPSTSWRDEYPIPRNALLCGRASGRRTRPL
ncbi:hypothetical protein Taro_017502 [Colocasia esculenta]|uniref:L-ascorbate oxidase n=1 Tax=Colocasia esculenta TaxID=4460 RepID=A0A843UN93_COLES|nr:hypothetical protein [Colocasia esculenta]